MSAYVKDIKQRFSCFYNKRKTRKGTLWGDRFKSVIVEQGNTLIHCLAYIDLNAVRAGIVKRPEYYRWCSIGYHIQMGNTDGFEMNRLRRFRYRSRYFTDSGIIGSRAFVESRYENFKDLFGSTRERIPKRVKGIEGMYSLKRLAEARFSRVVSLFARSEHVPTAWRCQRHGVGMVYVG